MVTLVLGYRIVLCFRGLCHDFPSKLFCLTVPENFAGEPSGAVFWKASGSEKVCGQEGKEHQDFRSKVFVSRCLKTSQGNPLVCH